MFATALRVRALVFSLALGGPLCSRFRRGVKLEKTAALLCWWTTNTAKRATGRVAKAATPARERERACVCVWYKKILTAALFFIYMGKQWQKVFAKIIVYLLAESHPGSDDRVGRDRGQRQIVRDRVQIA